MARLNQRMLNKAGRWIVRSGVDVVGNVCASGPIAYCADRLALA